jgi:hypothetical protein
MVFALFHFDGRFVVCLHYSYVSYCVVSRCCICRQGLIFTQNSHSIALQSNYI